MADINVNNPGTGGTNGPGRGGGGSTMMLALVVLVVLALIVFLVMRGGDDADVEVNVPKVETTEVEVPENVDVEVKSSTP